MAVTIQGTIERFAGASACPRRAHLSRRRGRRRGLHRGPGRGDPADRCRPDSRLNRLRSTAICFADCVRSLRVLLEALQDDRFELRVDIGPGRGHRWRIDVHDLIHQRGLVDALERHLAGEQLVEQTPSEKMSDRWSASCPCTCSGDI